MKFLIIFLTLFLSADSNITTKSIEQNPYLILKNYKMADLSQLKNKIKINKKAGNTLAVIRDNIKLDLSNTENKINQIYLTFASDLTTFQKQDEILKNIKEIKIDDFTEKYKEDLLQERNSTTKTKIEENLKRLETKIQKAKKIKEEFIKDLSSRLITESTLINKFSIDDIINRINLKSAGLNYKLRTLHIPIDTGRIVVFASLMISFLLLSLIITKIILPISRKLISKTTHTDSELLQEEFNSFKTPILIIMSFLGLESALEVLYHPEPLNINLVKIFLVIYTYNIVFIVMSLLDIIMTLVYNNKIVLKQRPEIINTAIRLLKGLLFLIATLYILTKLGVDPKNLLTSLGIGSVAIAFALKDTVANFFSGLKIIIDDTFSPGDWIKVSGEKDGVVLDITFTRTVIRTFHNSVLVIPNQKIVNSSYENWSRRKVGRKIGLKIGVEYNSKKEDLEKAINDIREMLENHPGISPKNADFSKTRFRNGKLVKIGDELGLKNTLMVHLDEFADSSIVIDIYAFSKSVVWSEWRETKEDVLKKIWTILENNNLTFAFPSQTVYLKGEN
jgi:MscS family membrane protein